MGSNSRIAPQRLCVAQGKNNPYNYYLIWGGSNSLITPQGLCITRGKNPLVALAPQIVQKY